MVDSPLEFCTEIKVLIDTDENNLKRMNNQARLDVIKRKREDFWFNPGYKQ